MGGRQTCNRCKFPNLGRVETLPTVGRLRGDRGRGCSLVWVEIRHNVAIGAVRMGSAWSPWDQLGRGRIRGPSRRWSFAGFGHGGDLSKKFSIRLSACRTPQRIPGVRGRRGFGESSEANRNRVHPTSAPTTAASHHTATALPSSSMSVRPSRFQRSLGGLVQI
jgi:hypothetical protein